MAHASTKVLGKQEALLWQEASSSESAAPLTITEQVCGSMGGRGLEMDERGNNMFADVSFECYPNSRTLRAKPTFGRVVDESCDPFSGHSSLCYWE